MSVHEEYWETRDVISSASRADLIIKEIFNNLKFNIEMMKCCGNCDSAYPKNYELYCLKDGDFTEPKHVCTYWNNINLKCPIDF